MPSYEFVFVSTLKWEYYYDCLIDCLRCKQAHRETITDETNRERSVLDNNKLIWNSSRINSQPEPLSGKIEYTSKSFKSSWMNLDVFTGEVYLLKPPKCRTWETHWEFGSSLLDLHLDSLFVYSLNTSFARSDIENSRFNCRTKKNRLILAVLVNVSTLNEKFLIN